MYQDHEAAGRAIAAELDAIESFPTPAPFRIETGAARAARERREAADRQRRSRERRRLSEELNSAIAHGLGQHLRRRKAKASIASDDDLVAIRVSLYDVVGSVMEILVTDYGWERPVAARALNDRLLR